MRDRIAWGLVGGLVMDLVLGLVPPLAAGAARAGDAAYVSNRRGQDGERAITVLWDSETSLRDCIDATVGRVQRQLQAIQSGEGLPYAAAELMPQDPCSSGQLGGLTQGTLVEVMPPAEECGSLVKVRVATGRNKERVGCMQPDRLSTQRVP